MKLRAECPAPWMEKKMQVLEPLEYTGVPSSRYSMESHIGLPSTGVKSYTDLLKIGFFGGIWGSGWGLIWSLGKMLWLIFTGLAG